ncbi:MAG: 2'-deoxycytidine 5'-triphosphate deaminase [Methyloligellaceae bacterium]
MALATTPYATGADAARGAILPCQMIEALVADGGIRPALPLADGQIQPASLDLRLGEKAYRVRASFLPGAGVPVRRKLDEFALHEIDLKNGAVLEVGCVYLVPLLESLKLPEHLSAACNPKSSTGRLDVFTRVIADGAQAFDKVEAGYQGALYAEICPQTFPVLVRTGSRLAQIRFRTGPSLTGQEAFLQKGADIVSLSVDLSGDAGSGLIGYRAKHHTGVVDVDAAGGCETLDFWEPILARGQARLILDPDQFYILASKEAVSVPPAKAAEMIPFNPLVGEFRVHYAGFFDPGFGYSQAGGAGSKAVLEVRSHKVPFILEDGQTIGQLVYEDLLVPPAQVYGQDIGSHYQAQGLKLSKHFRPPA